jgi:hypothetical protein
MVNSQEAIMSEEDAENALAIDNALNGVDLSQIGIKYGVKNALGNHPNAESIASCVHDKALTTLKKDAQYIVYKALNAEQLREGAALAKSPVFLKTKIYILAHYGVLVNEAQAAQAQVDDYLLEKSAENLDVSDDDKYVVKKFVAWHKQVAPAIIKLQIENIPNMIHNSKNLFNECKTSIVK